MKKLSRVVGLLAISVAFSSLALAGVTAVDMKPLSKSINISSEKGDVKKDNTLPQITWAEDMRLILANGYSANTEGGSIFNKEGLSYKLELKDSVISQSKDYVSGKSPFFRGTLSQVVQLNDLVYDTPDLRPVVISMLSFSAGGDSLVAKPHIKTLKDLKGKRIAVMAYGPHTYLALRTITKSAGLDIKDVEIVWVKDIIDTDQTPGAAFYDSSIDAAFMISPEAMGILEGDNAFSGAHELFSTKQASKVIADVYAVRSDYYQANKNKIKKLVHAQFFAKEKADEVFSDKKSAEFKKWMKASSIQLLGSGDFIADVEGMFEFDATHAGFAENVSFFTDARNGRNLERLVAEINDSLKSYNLVSNARTLAKPDWDWGYFKSGLKHANAVSVPAFNKEQVSKVIKDMQAKDTLDGEQFLTEEVMFKAGQSTFVFNQQIHGRIFDKIIDEANAYANTLIIIEAHSDPAYYLINKYKQKVPEKTLKRIRQKAWNLSVERAKEVRESIITYARDVKNIDIDESQFESIGYGIEKPITGICAGEPCKINLKGLAAKNKYAENRRAVIGFTRIEAEVETSSDDFDF
jgi:outer membrane protein OmpA-like peptidoglycan-associated protein